MNCIICQNQSKSLFQKNGYWIRECNQCHHRFAEIVPTADHPYKIYQDKYFNGGADGYPDYLAEAGIISKQGSRYAQIMSKFTTPGNLLDVGSAAGFILKGFQNSGWQGIGLEPNSSMAEFGQKKLGLQIEHGTLEQFSSNQQFDLVNMIQVIAHFFELRQALQKAADLTKPGGYWLIETWDKNSWPARLFGKNWHEYTPPGVLHWFSTTDLKLLAAQFGFSEIARGRPAKRISGAHAKSLLRYTLQNSVFKWMVNGIDLIPERLVIPYPSADLFWIIFQKNK